MLSQGQIVELDSPEALRVQDCLGCWDLRVEHAWTIQPGLACAASLVLTTRVPFRVRTSLVQPGLSLPR